MNSTVVQAGFPQSNYTWFQQKRNTFLLQLLRCVTQAEIESDCSGVPSDIRDRVLKLLPTLPEGRLGGGCEDPRGMEMVREAVVRFIAARDNLPHGSPDDIYLTNGVFGAAAEALKLLNVPKVTNERIGIVVPSPLYPAYDERINEYGFVRITFNLNPELGWDISMKELEVAYAQEIANCACEIRGMLLVNPDNPTGKVFSISTLQSVIKFAHANNLLRIVDEVFQFDILRDIPFISVRKAMHGLPSPYNKLEVISMNSISKGYIQEPGYRGGYLEYLNSKKLRSDYLLQLLDLIDCANTVGQVALLALVDPPLLEGEPSAQNYAREKDVILQTQIYITVEACRKLNETVGWSCSIPDGGKGLLAKVLFPSAAHEFAASKKSYVDALFARHYSANEGSEGVGPCSKFGLLPTTAHAYICLDLPTTMELVDTFVCKIRRAYQSFTHIYR